MNVSFDFDDTLMMTKPDPDDPALVIEAGVNEVMLATLRRHLAAGDNVCIITSRCEKFENRPNRIAVRTFLAHHGLARIPIHFTNGKGKQAVLRELQIDRHHDDDRHEVDGLDIDFIEVPLHPAWAQILNTPT